MSSVATLFNKELHKVIVPSKALALSYAKVGVEMEIENYRLTPAVATKLLPNWVMHPEEHSIRNNGMEFVTRGGLVGEDLINEIKLFCELAVKKEWSVGYPRAGLHIHVDVTDMNEKSNTELLHMMQTYMLFEHVFFGFAGQWRKACGFCDSWIGSQYDFPALSNMLYQWEAFTPRLLSPERFSKYQALNFLPLVRQGTLEFRHMPMTFDSQRIVDWINICLCLKRFAMETDLSPVDLLLKGGVEALTSAVFHGYEKVIEKLVNPTELWAALGEVTALQLYNEPGKLDPWSSEVDNPLLKTKHLEFAVKAPRVKAARKPFRLPPPIAPAAVDPFEGDL